MRSLLLALPCAVSFAAVAEDTPFMHLFGYSASGRYMAFQQTYLFKQGLDIGSDT